MIDTTAPLFARKCTQKLDISDGWVQMPVHPIDDDAQWHWYQIVAVSFHIGHSTPSLDIIALPVDVLHSGSCMMTTGYRPK